MKALQLNDDPRAGLIRFAGLETVRSDVQHVREQPDVPPVMIYVLLHDPVHDSYDAIRVGGSDINEVDALLLAVREGLLEIRRGGNDFMPDAPPTVCVLGVAQVFGADDMAAQMMGTGADGVQVLSEGYLATIVFTDLSVATFMGQESGMVDFVGCSAMLDNVDHYTIAPAEMKLDEITERSTTTDLALIIAALTGSPEELMML